MRPPPPQQQVYCDPIHGAIGWTGRRACPNEPLHLGFVVGVVHAGADERVDSARGQIESRQAGLMDVDVHGAQPSAAA